MSEEARWFISDEWPSRWRMFRDAYAIYRRERFRYFDAFLLAIGFARGGP